MNQLYFLLQQNNCLKNNQSLLNSQNNLTNLNQKIFLQKKRNSDELNNIFDTKAQFPFLEQKSGQNLENNNQKGNKENELDIKEDGLRRIIDGNSNLNSSFINNFNLIEKKNKSYNSDNTSLNINHIGDKNLICHNDDAFNSNKINEKDAKNFFNNQMENNNIDSKNDSPQCNIIIKNKYFSITNTIFEEKLNVNDKINTLNRKESPTLDGSENNNEVKVLKNNKAVYVNSCLLNSPSESKNLKKLNKIAFIGRSKRSSKFRGVSKNGNQWQVLLMHKKGKSYVGSYNSEELAAKIYDILAIKYRGVKARTNFKYTFNQIKKIGDIDFDIKSKNLGDLVAHLEI